MGAGLDIDYHPLQEAGRAHALGDLLRRLRAREALSQVAMARRIGMHPSYYSSLERGAVSNPGLMTLARLARGFGIGIGPLAKSYASRERVALPARVAPAPPEGVEPIAHGRERAAAMGRALAAMRERAGLTQSRLAEASGLQRTYVATIESGAKANTGIATVARLVDGIVPAGTDLSVVIPLLAQVFTGELGGDAFAERIADFLGSPPDLAPPRGPVPPRDPGMQGGGGAPR